MVFMAILVITLWVVTDPLNLAVSVSMAILLTLGFIVVDRADRPLAAARRSGDTGDDASPH
jgi:hypothetical protein